MTQENTWSFMFNRASSSPMHCDIVLLKVGWLLW